MTQTDSTAIVEEGASVSTGSGGSSRGQAGPGPSAIPGSGGSFRQYKPEQGKSIRTGTFASAGALNVWAAWYVYTRLDVYEGDEAWRLLVTHGIPIVVGAILFAITWWLVYSKRSSGDFMIATEGEMKKVSWSTRREVIGATKVVIMFTILLVAVLFVIDLSFQTFFSWINVLKT